MRPISKYQAIIWNTEFLMGYKRTNHIRIIHQKRKDSIIPLFNRHVHVQWCQQNYFQELHETPLHCKLIWQMFTFSMRFTFWVELLTFIFLLLIAMQLQNIHTNLHIMLTSDIARIEIKQCTKYSTQINTALRWWQKSETYWLIWSSLLNFAGTTTIHSFDFGLTVIDAVDK